MSNKILLTIVHDFLLLGLSFFFALWIRLDFDLALNLISSLWIYSIFFASSNIVLLKFFGLYLGIWRYASLHEIFSIIKSLIISTLMVVSLLFLIFRLENVPRSFPILLFIIALFSISGPRIIYRLIKDRLYKGPASLIPVYLVGAIDSVESCIRMTKTVKNFPYKVIGIINSKKNKMNSRIHNVPIIGSIELIDDLQNFVNTAVSMKRALPQRIILTDNNLSNEQIESVYVFSKRNGLAISEFSRMSSLSLSSDDKFQTKPIEIEDILGRKQKVQNTRLLQNLKQKVVLVTGAGGSIGSELCKQILLIKPKLLIMYEQNELNLYQLKQSLTGEFVTVLGDIRDTIKIENIIKKYQPNIIYHAAALKHITFVEEDPIEALKTNFFSTVKLSELSKHYDVEKFIFISTDKAVNPSNIMGATKRLCEKYLQKISINSKTKFLIVRFGNVLGSTGSVVPLFEKQISKGGPVTITHPDVQRYFMTIREAVELVLISSQLDENRNGVIFILEMGKPILIKNLAKKMIALLGKEQDNIELVYTGLRKGEKIKEELLFNNENISKTQFDGIVSTSDNLFQLEIHEYNKLILRISQNKYPEALDCFYKMLPEYVENEKNRN